MQDQDLITGTLWKQLVVQAHNGSYAQLLWNYPATWTVTSIMFLIYYEFYIKRKEL